MYRKSEPQNHILLKFISNKAYADDFMRGKLYMNSLEYFWNEYRLEVAKKKKDEIKNFTNKSFNENTLISMEENIVPGQMDLFEGICGTVKNASTLGFEQDFCDVLASDISLRAEGYRYCNVHCYYRMDYWYQNDKILLNLNPEMENFGEYVAIIDDEIKFLSLVNRAMNRQSYQYLCGSVRYLHPKKNGKNVHLGHHIVMKADDYIIDMKNLEAQNNTVEVSHRDCFCKMDSMQSQMEWRIAMYRGVKDSSAYTLELGTGLKDIAHIVKSGDLNAELMTLFQNHNIKHGIKERWYGNIDRKEMREKFYALGDYKASVLGIIGGSEPIFT